MCQIPSACAWSAWGHSLRFSATPDLKIYAVFCSQKMYFYQLNPSPNKFSALFMRHRESAWVPLATSRREMDDHLWNTRYTRAQWQGVCVCVCVCVGGWVGVCACVPELSGEAMKMFARALTIPLSGPAAVGHVKRTFSSPFHAHWLGWK